MRDASESNQLLAMRLATIIIFLVLLSGCGGGAGDASQENNSSATPEAPGEPATKEQFLQSIEATVGALEKEADRGKALEKVTISNQLAILPESTDGKVLPKDAQDECMTVDSRNETALLHFDGTTRCNDFSGTLEVTPMEDDDPDLGLFRNDIKMVDFSTGDGCPVNGDVSSWVTLKDQQFTDESAYSGLNVCGQRFSGKVVFQGDNWETTIAQLNTRTYSFDNEVTVKVGVSWEIDTSILNGEAVTTVDNAVLTIQVDRIRFDDTCNLPIGGTLTIIDPNGETILADFANTSCDQPTVAVDYLGNTEKWMLTAKEEKEEEEETFIARVKVLGKDEIVFDWSKDRCDKEDIPDFKARAFRDYNNNVQLISTHFANRRMIGETLDTVKRVCPVIMNSDTDPDPSKHNDHEWLSAFYTEDGKTIYALVINEFHGWEYPQQCPSGRILKCWYNSIGLAVSTDGGATYSHATAPSHLVASIPYPYVPDNSPYGIIGGTNILLNENDRWFYNMFHVENYGKQKKGVCIMRTKNLSDPKSWRAWDGQGYNVKFMDPYSQESFDPADHVCEPVSYESLNTMNGHLTYNTYFNKYLLVMAGEAWDANIQQAVSGFYFSLSDDLIHWSKVKLIKKAELWYTTDNTENRYAYASLIDPEDTSRNFLVSGQRPYLYYVKWYKFQDYNRDLVRVQLEFSK